MKVTEAAMRPASDKYQCFYCQQPIGGDHSPTCVLIKKTVKVRMIVEYEVKVPAHWGKSEIEFRRNEGTWCSDNAIEELEALIDRDDGTCLCPITKWEYIGGDSEPFLRERG